MLRGGYYRDVKSHQNAQGLGCLSLAMVVAPIISCVCQVTGKSQIRMWRKQHDSVVTTYAFKLNSMICLLGVYILSFQSYVCAKTKEYQTATGIQKLKTLTLYFIPIVSLHSPLYIISKFYCCMHYLAFYFHFPFFSLKIEDIFDTMLCNVIQIHTHCM